MSELSTLAEAIRVADSTARTTEDIFTSEPHWMPSGRVFGGQVVAQSLVAAQNTVDADRPVHSLHGYFLRAGDVTKPITLSVDRIHDGRSFSTRRTQAYQDGVPILSMIASFQHPTDDVSFAASMPTDVPEPDSLPTVAQLLEGLPETPDAAWARKRPVDIRHTTEPVYLRVSGERVPHQAVWMRSAEPLPQDPAVQRAALAYASDLSILEPVLRGLGVPWATPGLRMASLDHAMWFHRDVDFNDWVLYVQDATAAQSSRGLALGKLFSRDGRLVASVAQEGMVRVPR